MSDNLLLTVLGAVGVGALIMGMRQNEKSVKENFIQGYSLDKAVVKEIGNPRTGLSSVNFAQSMSASLAPKLAEIARMNKQGIPQNQQIATLQSQAVSNLNQQRANLSRAVAPQQFSNLSRSMGPVEHYSPPSQLGLGSSAVTRNDYVSYPQFNQSTPLQSPSLNLPAHIRYNPPSLDKMGITTAYQSDPMDYAGLVEGYTQVKGYPKNPEGIDLYGGQVNRSSGNIANSNNYLAAIDNGNKNYGAGDLISSGNLPLSSMDSGLTENPSASNTMLFDRFIYATSKGGGHRSTVTGGTDFIRGDLAVCVDPCQKGWFQASAQPKNLRTGAIQMLAGTSEAPSNSDVQRFAREGGSIMASAGNQGQSSHLSVLQKAISSNSGQVAQIVQSFS